ncbi:transglutaminase superfamily protein [Dermacoccus sp. SAI-028]|uniref:transglutaminase family protein n=1 Tax=Dermacoccus sp. SAI-028 TaxID=2768432 RepID=UPI001050FB4F|nr:DUF3488 and transglutaminase-like domain-containing protein [Dermacoccus sp. SAI-028]TCJ91386.1 transglutaminase superfamily protein [Dermacoccus sp. SAI-028]
MTTRRILAEVALGLLCLSACWPLVELSKAGSVGVPIVVAALVVWAIGAGLRRVGARSWLIVLAQAAAVMVSPLAALAAHGVSPTPSALRDAGHEAQKVANSSVAPLPAVAGVIAALTLGAALVALVVDYVGGTSKLPAATVLPVAAPFVLATTALGQTLPLPYFAAAAAAWALLMWLSTSRSRTLTGAPVFAAVTVLAVAGAAALSGHVPTRATPALAEGGARGVDTSVDFSTSLELTKDLSSRNAAPVLTYTTEDSQPGPLRVTTSSTYADGQWRARTNEPTTKVKANSEFPALGYDPAVPTTSSQATVTLNAMKPPFIAAPTTLRAAAFGQGHDTFDVGTTTGVPHLAAQVPAYAVIFRTFTAAARPVDDSAVSAGTGGVTQDDLDVASLPPAARTRIDALLTASGAGDATSRFDKAVAIQNHLRTDPSYTYSLTLAPTRTVDGAQLDPLSNFLETKQGYCTQYATAMVMSARSLGIPARVAIGFLPGTKRGNEYEVRAADAHAWPELYFPGMGWTRFEPTPGSRSGAAPAYARTSPSATKSSSSAPTTSSSAPVPSTRSVAPSTTQTSRSTSHGAPVTPHDDGVLGRVLLTLLGALAVIALLGALPLLGWWRRNRPVRQAREPRERDEALWHRMVWNLRDLGYVITTERSPQEAAGRFADDNPRASTHLVQAVERAAHSIENSRYAPTPARGMAATTERVTRAARSDASVGARLRAWLLPRSAFGARS